MVKWNYRLRIVVAIVSRDTSNYALFPYLSLLFVPFIIVSQDLNFCTAQRRIFHECFSLSLEEMIFNIVRYLYSIFNSIFNIYL